LTGAALVVIGAGQSGFAVMQATLVFTSAPTDRRLEAMGLLTMCIGVGPVGFLAVGWLGGRFGAPAALVICFVSGLACMLATWPWWRACLREPAQAGASPPGG
jgi:MFS family permease